MGRVIMKLHVPREEHLERKGAHYNFFFNSP